MSADGLVVWRSAFGQAETLARLKMAISNAGLTLFAHVDHAAGARMAGLELLPEDLIIFGNPRAGAGLMAARPTIGIDLPLKALVWRDADGAVWLGFNAPDWTAKRHALPVELRAVTDGIARLQADLAAAATR